VGIGLADLAMKKCVDVSRWRRPRVVVARDWSENMLASDQKVWTAFHDPYTGEPLLLEDAALRGATVMSGVLRGGKVPFPVVRGIPRFCPEKNYADSFGYQWQTFSETQLDSKSGWHGQSERRLYVETRWPKNLVGQRILEAGSGMGRFTEILARTGGEICTFDYSAAVEANARNNGGYSNVCFAQADICAPPFKPSSFDKVLCFGVLQHCPSPRKAFQSLVRFLKPGGEIAIDVYRLSWKSFFPGKYYVRPITRRLPAPALHRLVKFHVGWVYPLTGWLQRRIGRVGRSLSWTLAMADYRGEYPVDDDTARTLSELDTMDMLAPAFDRPQTIRAVREWFMDAGLSDIEIEPAPVGIVGRGKKPKQSDGAAQSHDVSLQHAGRL